MGHITDILVLPVLGINLIIIDCYSDRFRVGSKYSFALEFFLSFTIAADCANQ